MFELPSLEGVEEVVISKQVVEGSGAAAIYLRRRRIVAGTRRKCLNMCTAFGTADGERRARPRCPDAGFTAEHWGVSDTPVHGDATYDNAVIL